MQAIVDDVFGRLTAAGIPYCILRNVDIIPDRLCGWNDIDVLVPEHVTPEALASIFRPLSPAQVGHLRRGHVSFFFPVREIYLRIDIIYGDLRWKTISFIDHQDVLESRTSDRGYAVASPLHQAYLVLFSKLLWEGSLPPHYNPMVTDAVSQEPAAFRNLVAYHFGSDLADRLLNLALSERLDESDLLAHECRHSLMFRALRRHPVQVPVEFTRQIAHGVAQRLRPSGIYVVLLGPDGAGKTSVAAEIADSPMRRVAFKRVRTRLGYRETLPPIRSIASAILRRPLPPDSSHLDPHGAPPHHPLTWLLKFGYYTLDQWVEQVWIRREMAHTSLILKDRHLMELTIDPRRYRYGGPSVLPRMMARLQPQPTLLIVLDAPTDVLRSRKQEVTVEETARQRAAYREYAAAHPRGYVVNADQPLEDVIQDVLQLINAYATTNTQRRYKSLVTGHSPESPQKVAQIVSARETSAMNIEEHSRLGYVREFPR